MIKSLLFAFFIGLISIQVLAFSDVGYSKRNCQKAKQDAIVTAQGHCQSLGTDGAAAMRISKCSKKQKQFLVSVRYKCSIPNEHDSYEDEI